MLNLFKRNKKKEFKAHCDLSRQPLDKASSYLLTTADIISSKKFWDNKMTEPDTMTYTVAHFKSGDETATNIRKMIWEKYSREDKTWVISDAELHLFDIDQSKAKAMADEWWDNKGLYTPENGHKTLGDLGEDVIEDLKSYAIMEAGKSQVPA